MMREYIEGIVTKFHQLCESQLSMARTKFMAGNTVTIVDFVMISYAANTIYNQNGPFSAITKAILKKTPLFEAYCDGIMEHFQEQL